MASVVGELVIGPLAPFAERLHCPTYDSRLLDTGHQVTRGLPAHLSRWLGERGPGIRELTPEVAEKFLRMRRDAGVS